MSLCDESTVELSLELRIPLPSDTAVAAMSNADLCAFVKAALLKKIEEGITIRDRTSFNGSPKFITFGIGKTE